MIARAYGHKHMWFPPPTKPYFHKIRTLNSLIKRKILFFIFQNPGLIFVLLISIFFLPFADNRLLKSAWRDLSGDQYLGEHPHFLSTDRLCGPFRFGKIYLSTSKCSRNKRQCSHTGWYVFSCLKLPIKN